MAKTTTYTCDCGCDNSIKKVPTIAPQSWLILKQAEGAGENEPKIDGNLHFRDFDCLARWASKARKAIPELREQAESLEPHGMLRNRDVSGLYV